MTHEYTILVGAVVVPGGAAPDCTAIAWADDTVLAVGSDAEVRAISRGDSHVHELAGAVVRPADENGRLEVGGPADLRVQAPGTATAAAVIRGGRVVEGALPGDWHHAHEVADGCHEQA